MVATWSAVYWYDDVQPVDHPTLGAARLLWQYRGEQPRLQAFLDTLLDGLQSVEDVTLDVLTERWPLTAIGDQMDTLGKIVGQERGTLTDDEYRLFILARIMVNKSDGTIPELLEICDFLGCETIYASDGYCEVHMDVTDATYGNLIGDLIDDAVAGGCRLFWAWNPQLDDDSFQFAATLGADDADADSGFANLYGTPITAGGYFSGHTVGQ